MSHYFISSISMHGVLTKQTQRNSQMPDPVTGDPKQMTKRRSSYFSVILQRRTHNFNGTICTQARSSELSEFNLIVGLERVARLFAKIKLQTKFWNWSKQICKRRWWEFRWWNFIDLPKTKLEQKWYTQKFQNLCTRWSSDTDLKVRKVTVHWWSFESEFLKATNFDEILESQKCNRKIRKISNWNGLNRIGWIYFGWWCSRVLRFGYTRNIHIQPTQVTSEERMNLSFICFFGRKVMVD